MSKSYKIVKNKSIMADGKVTQKGGILNEKHLCKKVLAKYLKEGILVDASSEVKKEEAAAKKAAEVAEKEAAKKLAEEEAAAKKLADKE